ncbi:MAG TPA: DNA-3-methyladenine glycosylase [Candidatus Paceibacterota bacterium]
MKEDKSQKFRILPSVFFDRNSLIVAKDLIGKFLVREVEGKKERYLITEVESYEGFKDKASHAHRGQTPRNTPMFGEPGTIYVYLTYGMHFMLNITCGKVGYPSAVLIRGTDIISGPGRLTKKLKIDKSLNVKKLSKKNGLWIEEGLNNKQQYKIKRTPRIGVSSSGEVWSKKLYRFVLES